MKKLFFLLFILVFHVFTTDTTGMEKPRTNPTPGKVQRVTPFDPKNLRCLSPSWLNLTNGLPSLAEENRDPRTGLYSDKPHVIKFNRTDALPKEHFAWVKRQEIKIKEYYAAKETMEKKTREYDTQRQEVSKALQNNKNGLTLEFLEKIRDICEEATRAKEHYESQVEELRATLGCTTLLLKEIFEFYQYLSSLGANKEVFLGSLKASAQPAALGSGKEDKSSQFRNAYGFLMSFPKPERDIIGQRVKALLSAKSELEKVLQSLKEPKGFIAHLRKITPAPSVDEIGAALVLITTEESKKDPCRQRFEAMCAEKAAYESSKEAFKRIQKARLIEHTKEVKRTRTGDVDLILLSESELELYFDRALRAHQKGYSLPFYESEIRVEKPTLGFKLTDPMDTQIYYKMLQKQIVHLTRELMIFLKILDLYKEYMLSVNGWFSIDSWMNFITSKTFLEKLDKLKREFDPSNLEVDWFFHPKTEEELVKRLLEVDELGQKLNKRMPLRHFRGCVGKIPDERKVDIAFRSLLEEATLRRPFAVIYQGPGKLTEFTLALPSLLTGHDIGLKREPIPKRHFPKPLTTTFMSPNTKLQSGQTEPTVLVPKMSELTPHRERWLVVMRELSQRKREYPYPQSTEMLFKNYLATSEQYVKLLKGVIRNLAELNPHLTAGWMWSLYASVTRTPTPFDLFFCPYKPPEPIPTSQEIKLCNVGIEDDHLTRWHYVPKAGCPLELAPELILLPYSKLDLSGNLLKCPVVAFAALASRLTELDVSGNELTSLAFISPLTALKKLNASNNPKVTSLEPSWRGNQDGNPPLEEMNLTNIGISSLAALVGFKNLRVLTITRNICITTLEELGPLEHLEKIVANSCGFRGSWWGIFPPPTSPFTKQILHLELAGCSLEWFPNTLQKEANEAKFCEYFSKLEYFRPIEGLTLIGTPSQEPVTLYPFSQFLQNN